MSIASNIPSSASGATSAIAASDRYAKLLEEAAAIRGVSLWLDAWRRLKRNSAAIVSLTILIIIMCLAFLTPLLPFQSPSLQLTDNEHAYAAPSLKSAQLPFTLEEVVAAEKRIADLQQSLRTQSADEKEATQKQLTLALRQHPITAQWNNPGSLTYLMIRSRLAVFGRWSIPSICGRDQLGRDLLSRIFWGSRVSLMVGIVAAIVSLVIGVLYGAISGFAGGIVDAAMMRIVDVLYSIPFIFVVIFAITILSEESLSTALAAFGIDQIAVFYMLIGAIYWLTMARVVRGQVLSLKQEQFIDAARCIGASSTRIVLRHLVPNVLGIVIIYLTLTIPSVMLFEAFLSFLGLGVQAPDVSWGLLVFDGIKVITPLQTMWWLVLYPGLALAITLFALNFLGDGLRDALDPRLKNR
jgi:oligopeptide transport system permease protein